MHVSSSINFQSFKSVLFINKPTPPEPHFAFLFCFFYSFHTIRIHRMKDPGPVLILSQLHILYLDLIL